MGSSAEINKVAALVDSDALAVLDLAGDGLHLEWVVLEEVQSLLLRQHEALELLVLACDFLSSLLDHCIILFGEKLKFWQKRQVLVNHEQLIASIIKITKRYICELTILKQKVTYVLASVAIVEEAVLRGRSVSQMHTEFEL